MTENPAFLYVDDDATGREVMELLLVDMLGYPQLFMLANSQDFLEKLEALPAKPDIIFLDINVTPIDGFGMLKLLREHSHYKNTTIVAVTASVMSQEVEQLQAAGFDGGIAKPIPQDVFPELVRQILKGEKVWHIF